MIEPVKLAHVSATQVDAFDRCPRLWFYQKVLGIKTPETAAMGEGKEIHKLIEPYLLTGKEPPQDNKWYELVMEAIKVLPREEGLLVEHEFLLPTGAGLPKWLGYIDTLYAKRLVPWINDHKTISDFRYMKTPEEIRNNPQLMAYAQFTFYTFPEAQEVDIGHTYLRKRGKAKVIQPPPIRVSRAHVSEQWSGLVGQVREMNTLATSPPETAREVPCDTNHCGDYGGCFFRRDCGVIPSLFSTTTLKKETAKMSTSTFSEKLAAKRAAAAGAPPMGSHFEAPGTPGAVEAAKPGLLTPPTHFPYAKGAVPVGEDLPADKCPDCRGGKMIANPENNSGWFLCNTCGGSGKATASPIVPPDAPARTSTPEEIAAMNAPPPAKEKKSRVKKEKVAEAPSVFMITVTTSDGQKHKVDAKLLETMTPDQAVEHMTAEANAKAQAEAEEKAKAEQARAQAEAAKAQAEAEARKKEAEIAAQAKQAAPAPQAAPAVQAAPAPVAQVAAPTPQVSGKPARKVPPKAPTIFVDVMPMLGTDRPVLLEQWMAPIIELLSESMGLADYRMDFANKANGALHSAILDCLDTLPEFIFVKSSYTGANVFLEAVIPHAKQIYQRVQ